MGFEEFCDLLINDGYVLTIEDDNMSYSKNGYTKWVSIEPTEKLVGEIGGMKSFLLLKKMHDLFSADGGISKEETKNKFIKELKEDFYSQFFSQN